MRKLSVLFLALLLLNGCATYKFHYGRQPYDKGYVVSRDGLDIAEYTKGINNEVAPDIGLAQERFNRRKAKVEEYYKKMGLIESRFKAFFWDFPSMFADFLVGIFRLPFIGMANHKYEHNLAYKAKVDQKEDEAEAKEKARLDKLKSELDSFLKSDLSLEQSLLETPALPETELAPLELEKEPEPEVVIGQESRKLAFEMETQKEIERKARPLGPEAVILAKPVKGISPLTVHFSAARSRSGNSKIVSYLWDFGDGDSAAGKNTVNTYYSGSFEPRVFNVTLTIKDSKDNTASSKIAIEVLNR